MRRLIFGCGYLGRRVAKTWRDQGDEVWLVTRSTATAETWRADGYRALVADVTDPQSLVDLPSAATVLWAVGYDRRAGQSIEQVYVAGLAKVLAALPSDTGRVIYISSTGVYGSAAGQWVDELTPCVPLRAGGRACLAAEECLAAHRLGARSVVLRLAGIYGPGRIPRAESLRAGEPIDAPADGYLNLIHVDDAAAIVVAAAERAPIPRLYVVSDGQPGLRREYYGELARLLHAPPPTFVAPEPTSAAAQRAASDKRTSNARLVAELGVPLQYPSYREGLAAIVAGDSAGAGR